jgi:hypothetical protein
MIKDMCLKSDDKRVSFEDVREKILKRGYKDEQLNEVIDQYQRLTTLAIDENNNVFLLEKTKE